MIIPIRCYSCGAVIAQKYEKYRELIDTDYTEAEALDALHLKRYCCRRMILSHIDLIDDLIPYSVPVVGTMPAMSPMASTATGRNSISTQQRGVSRVSANSVSTQGLTAKSFAESSASR